MAKPSESNAELMSAALDEQLAPDEAEAFAAILAESPETREEFEQLQNMLALVHALPEVEAPADFYDKVAKKIRRRRLMRGESFSLVSLPFQVLSVMVVLAVGVIYMMLQLDRDPANALVRDPPSAQNPASAPAPKEH
jgi:anti-sigma factor RsiW